MDRKIRRMETLPPDHPRRGAPEFAALRTALREMAEGSSEPGHRSSRGTAPGFQETARRVAHEMRNPLTPIRLAVAQLPVSRARAPGDHRGSREPSLIGSSNSPESSPSSVACRKGRPHR